MKLLLSYSCLMLSFLLSGQNTYLGIDANNGLSFLQFSDNVNIEAKPTHSYHIGALWGNSFNKKLSFETGLLYSKQGEDFRDNYNPAVFNPPVPVEISVEYFKLPLLINFRALNTQSSSVSVFVGGAFSHLLSKHNIFRVPFEFSGDYYFGTQDISTIVGFRYEKMILENFSFSVGLFYEKGFLNVLNYRFHENQYYPPYISCKNTTAGISLRLNYHFNNNASEAENFNVNNSKLRKNIISFGAGYGSFLHTVNYSSNDGLGQFVIGYPFHYERLFQINKISKIGLGMGIYFYQGIAHLLNDEKKPTYLSEFRHPVAVDNYSSAGLRTGISLLSGEKHHLEISLFTSTHTVTYEMFASHFHNDVEYDRRFLLRNVIIYSGYRFFKPEKTPFTFKGGVQYEYQKKLQNGKYGYSNIAFSLGGGIAF